MYQWASDLFPLNRSLTGDGVRETVNYIKNVLPELEIFEVPSGTKVFDWAVPKEWRIREGWIADINGNKLIDLAINNLHIMGYSISVDKIVSRSDLEPNLYSLSEQPNAIPYITSYYKENFGFCLIAFVAERERLEPAASDNFELNLSVRNFACSEKFGMKLRT